jgi:hypothetical protein
MMLQPEVRQEETARSELLLRARCMHAWAHLQPAVLPCLQVSFSYFNCFIRTMRREWFGIDRHRLDKFLMLIRAFVHQLFVYLATKKW